MEVAKISTKGQITIPIEIRKKLKVNPGDRVVFMEQGEKIIIANADKVIFISN